MVRQGIFLIARPLFYRRSIVSPVQRIPARVQTIVETPIHCVKCIQARICTSSSNAKGLSRFTSVLPSRKLEYSERKVLRYPVDMMYCIVEDVDRYSEFVPWCKKSVVLSEEGKVKRAKLEVGFGKITEKYNSTVTCVRPHLVKAVCTDGALFNSLLCIWRFAPGRTQTSCVVDFQVSFEFRSLLYSQVANMVFNEIVKTMVQAFEKRAKKIEQQEKAEMEKTMKQMLP